MNQPIEIKVKISNEEQNYIKKFLSYKPISMDKDDPVLSVMVGDTMEEFKGSIETVKVNLSMNW